MPTNKDPAELIDRRQRKRAEGRLTTARRRELERCAATPPPGVYRRPFYGTGSGLARKGWVTMMEALADAGLVARFADNGYEITAAGRAALESPPP